MVNDRPWHEPSGVARTLSSNSNATWSSAPGFVASMLVLLASLNSHPWSLQQQFTTMLTHRGYEGSFQVDYESKRLQLSVNTNKDGSTNPESLKALSGTFC